MYTYYLLSSMGPQFQKYLWWKKYLTGLQMTQFILIMVHAFQLLFIDCKYPKAFVWWIGMHAVMFFFLFKEFYTQSYKTKVRRINLLQYDVLIKFYDIYKDKSKVHQNGNFKHNDVLTNGYVDHKKSAIGSLKRKICKEKES